MRKEIFAKKVTEGMKEVFKGYEVFTRQVEKLNKSYLALVIRNESFGPSINLDYYYDEFNGTKLTDDDFKLVMSTLECDIKRAMGEADFTMEKINKVISEKKVYKKVVNADINSKMLEKMPHRIIAENLAETYYIKFSEDEEGTATSTVTNDFLKIHNIDMEDVEIIDDKPILKPMAAILMESLCDPLMPNEMRESLMEELGLSTSDNYNLLEKPEKFEIKDSDEPQMFVLTNERRVNGASVLSNEEVMKKIGEMFGGNYIILPSSIHELILLPEKEGTDFEGFKVMVGEVNRDEVSDADLLSGNVYRYNAKKGIVEIAA